MSERQWTDLQDDILFDCYPKFGPSWKGWAEVLPGRTKKAIGERARRLGLSYRFADKGDDRHYRPKALVMAPDPYEPYVVKCMEEGMTPTQIDCMMRWLPGSARLIMSNKWLREKERYELRGER